MKFSKKHLAALAVAFIAMIPWTSAFSQTAEFSYYGGVGYLSSTFGDTDDFCNTFGILVTFGTDDVNQTRGCDSTSDSGLKIYGGWRLNQNLAVEAGYADFGKITANETVTGLNTDTYRKDSVGISSVYVAAVGMYPVSESVDLFGKLGYHRYSQDNKTSGRRPEGVLNTSGTTNDLDILYGIGAQWISGSDFSVRGEWEKFTLFDGTGDVSALTVSVIYPF